MESEYPKDEEAEAKFMATTWGPNKIVIEKKEDATWKEVFEEILKMKGELKEDL